MLLTCSEEQTHNLDQKHQFAE